jgi:integrase
MRDALRPLRELYGLTDASKFGPKALKKVRQFMVGRGLARGVINNRVNRIKRTFKWAVAEELIPPFVFHGLQAVGGLRFGRTEARETEPVKPVGSMHVHELMPFVAPPVAAMIELQWLTGMRSGEVVIMRSCDIDTTDEIWIYEASDHKNRWRGHRKLVPLGPKAQAILKPFLNRDKEAYLFSPREAGEWRLKSRPILFKADRKTPVYPSELKAREKAKHARRRRTSKRLRDHYDTDSYRRAIMYGLKKARKAGVEIPHWHPHQLRHSLATEIRKIYGIEAAQVALGHARADVTEVYAEKNMEIAKRIAREMG